MFESHFGLSASPFQLSPDPRFFFESSGHKNALAYLRFGVYQQEGFIVVTGDIGAGKTTLVRTLINELNADEVVAAQVLNTQLNDAELLSSICNAFGVPTPGQSKAQLLGSLEAFFTAVAASGRRSLLIIDEAQNLGHREVEELRMLSNFQIGNRALLQSFLVGQPELRRMVAAPEMEQLRQRIMASCHLGPLDASEVRAYIEHRLNFANWDGTPIFVRGAIEEIFVHTGGVPRRINLLCGRLMHAAALANKITVDANAVRVGAADLRQEMSYEPNTAIKV